MATRFQEIKERGLQLEEKHCSSCDQYFWLEFLKGGADLCPYCGEKSVWNNDVIDINETRNNQEEQKGV